MVEYGWMFISRVLKSWFRLSWNIVSLSVRWREKDWVHLSPSIDKAGSAKGTIRPELLKGQTEDPWGGGGWTSFFCVIVFGGGLLHGLHVNCWKNWRSNCARLLRFWMAWLPCTKSSDANTLLTETVLILAVLVLQDPTMDWVTMGYPQLAQALRDKWIQNILLQRQ